MGDGLEVIRLEHINFGDYLKSRRTELGWTQPEAAAKVRIEQSYLSKLENGRSIPSEEVYQRIAAAYGLDTEAMVVSLYPAELDRLREIEAVRKHLLTAAQNTGAARRGWLYAGLAALNEARILGVFARLIVRDGKPRYRAFMPRMWAHLRTNLTRPGLEPVRDWFAAHVPEDRR
jgi:transcriptional regulator with XRE-family HTH domain